MGVGTVIVLLNNSAVPYGAQYCNYLSTYLTFFNLPCPATATATAAAAAAATTATA